MLANRMLAAAAGADVGEAFAVVFRDAQTDNVNRLTYTFTVDVGAAGGKFIVGFTGAGTQGDEVISGITLDGTAMSLGVAANSAGGGRPSELWYLDGTTENGSVDIVVDFTTVGAGLSEAGLAVWRIGGAATGAVADSATSNANPMTTGATMSTGAAGGVMIGCSLQANATSASFVWSGLSTEDYDETLDAGSTTWQSGAHELFATQQTNITVVSTPTGTGDSQWAMAVIAVNPA